MKKIPAQQAFTELCKQHKWRRTAQRLAVFECIMGNTLHPTVEQVWRAVRETLPLISLDSVYRILDDFASVGVLQRMEIGRVARYDPNQTRHDHFVCSRCDRIVDFDGGALDELDRLCSGIGTAMSHEITVRGLCDACRAGNAQP